MSFTVSMYGKKNTGNGKFSSATQAAFTPLRTVDFNGLSNNQSVSVNTSGSVAGKRFDADATAGAGNTFLNGYGMRADTSVYMPGKTSSAKLSIAAGSDGDPAGGGSGTGYGPFGGWISFSGADKVAQGEECWVQIKFKYETGFDPYTNSVALKFVRFETDANQGRLEHHITNGVANGSPTHSQVGWALASEMAPKNQENTMFATQPKITMGEWQTWECYIKPHSDGAQSVRRIWLNGAFVYERNGNVNKYINTSGVLTTMTMSQAADKTLWDASDKLRSVFFHTYWNGGSPQNQAMWIQEINIHKNPATLTATDAYGNLMMGAF